MGIGSEWHGIRDVAAHLPFELDDTEEVNRAFQKWRSSRLADAKRVVEIWTYCFVKRYFLLKFAREVGIQLSDFDDLVARTYRKIEVKAHTVDNPDRYAQWVSKICKNTFLNYIRTPRYAVPLHDESPELAEELMPTISDFGILLRAVSAAIGRLPTFLQGIAHMRFIEQRSYEEIGRVTGKPLPVVRSYASKAVARFRQDRHLRAIVEPPADPSAEPLPRPLASE